MVGTIILSATFSHSVKGCMKISRARKVIVMHYFNLGSLNDSKFYILVCVRYSTQWLDLKHEN